ncbi:ataxin-2-like protein [Anneissia japonica]|uniref:ataxin-2-like protein n=1 Tax=Anneissia japonica TaxID=1529436 RepID=UPI001425B9D8|nr:ataxin-2-like protein [Anneissia japonica]
MMSTQQAPQNKRKGGRTGNSGHGRNRNSTRSSNLTANSQSHSTPVIPPRLYANAHFVHATAVLKGLKVQVVVVSGKKYEGIFSTISNNGEIVIELAHMVEGNTNAVPSKERTIDKLVVKFKDVVSLTALDVDLEYAVKSDVQPGFQTDSDISGKKSNGQAGERELQQWTPSNETPADLSLDGDTNGWSVEDMFKANEKQFGYESSYDTTLKDYTTLLRKEDTEEFRQKSERANRLAMEIEESAGYKQRAALELDDGQTEEDRFSAVQRPKARMSPSGSQQGRSASPKGNPQFDGNASTNKYVPPHLRNNKPAQRNYNQPSHRPHTPTQGGQRGPTHAQNMARPPRHAVPDERLTMQDVRMSPESRQSQDVRLSQDARLAYEPRPQRSAAQVVAGSNPQRGMVPQQQNVMKQREVKPESIGISPSPGPPANMAKQPTKDIPRVPSPMVGSLPPTGETNPQHPVASEDKKPQKSQKSQKISELNEFSNNFRLQENQTTPSNNHVATQAHEAKPVQSLNPAPTPQQGNQQPVPQQAAQQVAQPSSQSPQTRPVPPPAQAQPQALITQIIQQQPLPAQKLGQAPSQVSILQHQAHSQAQPISTAQPPRPVDEKKPEFKLNPNAKEFTLNPSAKPFTPNSLRKGVSVSKTPTPPRPHSRQSQSPTLHPPSMPMTQIMTGGPPPPHTFIPQMPSVVYAHQIPLQKKYPKSPATNLPQPPRQQQPGDISGQMMSASTATGQPLLAPSHFVPPYHQHPGAHPGQMIPGQPIMQPQPMPFVQMQQQKLPYRHASSMSNVQQSQAQLHPLPEVSPNTPLFVTPQGSSQVYPGQQQPSVYPHHPSSAQQGGQQHPQGQAGHHQMVQSAHPHSHGAQQGQNQHHQGQPQGHRPTPSPVQHSIQSPSQSTQQNIPLPIYYNMPQHSQPIQGHTPQSQQTFTTVLMHQQQQQPQPQPYSATSHSITNMTTVHTSPHPHPHAQPGNVMYVGGGQPVPQHSHTVMLPSGSISYLPPQGGQGQHPPIQAYQQTN